MEMGGIQLSGSPASNLWHGGGGIQPPAMPGHGGTRLHEATTDGLLQNPAKLETLSSSSQTHTNAQAACHPRRTQLCCKNLPCIRCLDIILTSSWRIWRDQKALLVTRRHLSICNNKPDAFYLQKKILSCTFANLVCPCKCGAIRRIRGAGLVWSNHQVLENSLPASSSKQLSNQAPGFSWNEEESRRRCMLLVVVGCLKKLETFESSLSLSLVCPNQPALIVLGLHHGCCCNSSSSSFIDCRSWATTTCYREENNPQWFEGMELGNCQKEEN